MIIENLTELLELIKDVAPFAVSVFTYIALLFAFKYIFKAHRNNVLVYIGALIITIGFYFSFINVFDLARKDYFMDGLKLVLKYFYELSGVLFVIFVNLLMFIKMFNLTDLPSLFKLTEMLINYLENVDVSTCAYLAFHQSYKYKRKLVKKARFFIENAFKYIFIVNKANSLNCVFNC